MSNEPTLDEFTENAQGFVHDTWDEKGAVHGMAAVHCTRNLKTGEPSNDLVLVMGDFEDADAKDDFAAVVRRVARQGDAFAIAFVSEAYTAVYDKDEETPTTLAGRPESQECVVLAIEHRDGARTLTADITRRIPGDETSPGALGEWRMLPGDKMTGRFANMLPGAGGN